MTDVFKKVNSSENTHLQMLIFLRTFFHISTKGESSLFLKIIYSEVRHEKKSKVIIRYCVYQSVLRRSENYENHDEMEMCIKIANSSNNLFP